MSARLYTQMGNHTMSRDISYCNLDGCWVWPRDIDAEEIQFRDSMLRNLGIKSRAVLVCPDFIYWVDKGNNEIMRTTYAGEHECPGNGAINVHGYNKRREEHTISAKIVDCTTKDSEIIPFDPNPEVNEQGIKDFLQRYIYKPYTISENVVGVEVNFNKEFYVPETIEPVDSILAEISDIDKAIANLEKGVRVMISIFTIYSDICKISAPAHWQIRRFKDIITSSRSGIWGDEEKGDANDIVCYRVADFDYSNLCLKFDNITYRNVLPEQANEKLLSKGDLLLEKSGGGEKMPVGRVVLVNSPLRAVCSNFIQALSVNKKAICSICSIFISFNIFQPNKYVILQPNHWYPKSKNGSLSCPRDFFLPPYSEQEAIAAYLDKECEKIGRKIELLERKADAYSRLRRSLINRAVTRGLDPNVSLKTIWQ